MDAHLANWISEMIEDEEEGAESYIDLANALLQQGYPKDVTGKIFKMALDEDRHRKTLLDLFRKKL